MRLKSRFIPVALVVAVAAIAIFFIATIAVINQAFTKVETDSANQNAGRVTDTLANRVDELHFKAVDWSDWDDTYGFVVNRNAEYVKSNLQASSLTSLGIHYMLFYNTKQQLVYGMAVDPSSGDATTVPPGLLTAFKPGSKLLATGDSSESKGVLTIDNNQSVQFVALPILDSNGDGPYHGTLVFAAVITPDEVALTSKLTHLGVSLYRLDDPNRPTDVKANIGTPKGPTLVIARPSSKTIVAYQTLNDVYGNPALVARVQKPRDIHQAATGAIGKFALISVVSTALWVSIVVMLFMLVRSRERTITLKNEFFSIASHELRTPLTVIRNYAQLMKFKFSSTIKDPHFDHMTEQIDQAGAQLIGVVNVYLDAARLESGKIPFEAQAFSLAALTTTLEQQLKATAKSKGLQVDIQVPIDLPKVLADQERVRQVILNLFGNAMKFTETGGITIKAEPGSDKKMHVYVTDTGRGMDEITSRQLFQRFKQVQAKDALRGSGLGLFISKKIVELMGGTIQVESSAPGIGTTIGFSLPLAPDTPAPAPAAPPKPATPAPIVTVLPPENPAPASAPAPAAQAAPPQTPPAPPAG